MLHFLLAGIGMGIESFTYNSFHSIDIQHFSSLNKNSKLKNLLKSVQKKMIHYLIIISKL